MLIELAWAQAYILYKSDADSGELTQEEVLELKDRAKHFIAYATAYELIAQYPSPSSIEEGAFMGTIDVFV